ncbi:hypothetical protein CEP52_000061 [Fusarium oligoseptatum]|uniref:Uncharacterized protein n=1 Tax=Fusarium oligoseptatum TaxID=2604345 RepID=A0A428UQA0_9HYPO|nr:hypothetical protein CEP52_000061 [Fusarium oligoseptatum]
MSPFTPPSDTEMALINFDNIYSYGLPSYGLTDRMFIQIAMPEILADERFCGDRFDIEEADMRLLRDPTSPNPVSLFGVNTVIGPIWRAPEPPETTVIPTADEYETISGRWKPSGACHPPFWFDELRSKIKAALDEMIFSEHIEIRPGLRLDVDASLMPFLREPLEGEDSLSDTPEPFPQKPMVPRMSPMRLAEFLIPLQHTRRALSVHWRVARCKLQDMDVGGFDEANRTVVRVLEIIREAREQTKAEIKGLNELVASLENDPASVAEPFFWGTVAQRICRMVGLDASTDLDEDAWAEDLMWKLRDHQAIVAEMATHVMKASRDELVPDRAVDFGIQVRAKLENLIAKCDFEGQGDLLEVEYQLLVQQVDELSS